MKQILKKIFIITVTFSIFSCSGVAKKGFVKPKPDIEKIKGNIIDTSIELEKDFDIFK